MHLSWPVFSLYAPSLAISSIPMISINIFMLIMHKSLSSVYILLLNFRPKYLSIGLHACGYHRHLRLSKSKMELVTHYSPPVVLFSKTLLSITVMFKLKSRTCFAYGSKGRPQTLNGPPVTIQVDSG